MYVCECVCVCVSVLHTIAQVCMLCICPDVSPNRGGVFCEGMNVHRFILGQGCVRGAGRRGVVGT